MPLNVRQNYVICRKVSEQETKAGLVLPESLTNEHLAEVVAVGPGAPNEDSTIIPIEGLEPGQRVIAYMQQALEFPWEGDNGTETLFVIQDEGVVATLD